MSIWNHLAGSIGEGGLRLRLGSPCTETEPQQLHQSSSSPARDPARGRSLRHRAALKLMSGGPSPAEESVLGRAPSQAVVMPRGFLVKRHLDEPAGVLMTSMTSAFHHHHLHHHLYPPSAFLHHHEPIYPLYPETSTTPPPLDLSLKSTHAPITPPSTPSPTNAKPPPPPPPPPPTTCDPPLKKHKPIGNPPARKHKAARRLHFDEDNTSPVSGTIIRELSADDPPLVVRKGDIDPAFNLVEVTEEAKAELAKIENRIGDYICRLCKEMYEDAFSLAQHRCSRIVHIEYRCPECDKVFNCPANLASHRRWHKPRQQQQQHQQPQPQQQPTGPTVLPSEQDALYPCPICRKHFRRQAYLRKHLVTHESPSPVTTTLHPAHPQPLTLFQTPVSAVN